MKASLAAANDVSLLQQRHIRRCSWCRCQLPEDAPREQIFCSRKHRQTAWRVRQRVTVDQKNRRPIRCAFADPPYPGNARKYYGNQPSYRGEVDHAALIASLRASYDGWALSTSVAALREILPLCPPKTRVCAWVKPIGTSSQTFGIHNCWEPLLVVPGRQLRPGKRDWLSAQPARKGGSDLIGRKPEAFCVWMFELLGMLPGDSLDDLFPGSGIVSRAWAEVCRGST